MRRHTPDSPLSGAADTSDPGPYSRARVLPCSRTRPARRLGFNSIGVEGAQIMADLLKTNSALKELQCAAARPFPDCQEPLTLVIRTRSQT